MSWYLKKNNDPQSIYGHSLCAEAFKKLILCFILVLSNYSETPVPFKQGAGVNKV